MSQSEMKNAPPLYGWAIATGMGVVAFAVSLLLVGIEGNGSVAIGAVIALVVGIIFTVAERGAPPAKAAGTAPTVSSTRVSAPAPAPAAASTATTTSAAAPSTPATPAPVAATPEPTKAEPATPAAPDDVTGTKPDALAAPVGEADDLKRISGVGPVLEGKLNGLGIYHFWQIARWSADEVAWVDGFLNFKGRIERDNWIDQAKTLAADSPSKPPA